jgi:response regulator RpfG family c-di-GMP phosphodiesterase
MQQLFSKLSLFHKVSFSLYLTIILISILAYKVYFSFMDIKNETAKNAKNITTLYMYSDNIQKQISELDYFGITIALKNEKDSIEKLTNSYKNLIDNINNLREHEYLQEDSRNIIVFDKLQTRIKGYKNIVDSLKDEVDEDVEDALYALLALSKANSIINSELDVIAKNIKRVVELHNKSLEDDMSSLINEIAIYALLLLIFLIINNYKVATLIVYEVSKIHDAIESFFDFLSKKISEPKKIKLNSDDEIGKIADIIDEHMDVAKQILLDERGMNEEIVQIKDSLQVRVKDATKEILELNEELENTQREVVFTIGAVAERRSKETGDHVKRVAEYSLILARLYGLSLEESILLKNASPMHDIGKIGIPDDILNKKGKLDEKEFEIMKEHSLIGYEMLKHSNKSILKAASIVAYTHHEKYDGSGYPRGLRGENIHIYGRITALADVFDALGSDRVYKKAWSLEKILDYIQEQRGKQFDPLLVDIFFNNLEHFLAAKYSIEAHDEKHSLSTYIEDFDKVDKYISK